jgi:hypothetical protein
LEFLTGDWSMVQSVHQEGDTWLDYVPQHYRGEAQLRGTVVQAEVKMFVTGSEILPVRFVCAWDGARSVFRMMVIDSEFGYPDVYQGAKNAKGNIILTNAHTGTDWGSPGKPMCGRWQMIVVDPNAFGWKFDVSTDEGATWMETMRFEFRRV